MKLLYLTQVFELAEDTGSDRHSFFCRYAAKTAGWDVTAITSNVDYKKAVPRYPGKWFVSRPYDGIHVHYVYSFANFRGSIVSRAWYFITYFAATIFDALRMRRPDAVYAVSTPLTVGFLGLILSKLWRRPFVFEVTDLWPDGLVALGVVKRGPLLSFMRWMERTCYRHAAHLVALTKGIEEGIVAKGVPREKVTLITNGFDPELFARADPNAREAVRKKLGVAPHEFLCTYLGAHGIYNSLGTIIEAAIALKHRPDIKFVLLGDGDDKARLIRLARENGLTNVQFLDPIPRSESVDFLTAADAFLIPNRAGEFFRMNLPNKLFDFLATARPILVAGAGETPDVITAARCGVVVPAEDAKGMAAAITDVAAMSPEERRAMGLRGRDYAMAHYSRAALSERFMATVRNAVERRA
jgi:glycosyltransferase involved in cell wall biosynthesis